MHVGERQCDVCGQRSLDSEHEAQVPPSLETVRFQTTYLRLSKSIERFDRRHNGKQIQEGRGGDEKLLLILSVETRRLQRDVFRGAPIENSDAAAKDGLRRPSGSR